MCFAITGRKLKLSMHGGKLTLIPLWLLEDLVTASHGFVEILSLARLLDFGVVVRGVAPKLVQASGLDAFFNGREVN